MEHITENDNGNAFYVTYRSSRIAPGPIQYCIGFLVREKQRTMVRSASLPTLLFLHLTSLFLSLYFSYSLVCSDLLRGLTDLLTNSWAHGLLSI